MSAPEVVAEVTKPATTYEWLGSLPLAASAGNTVYSWYEGTKNCCRVSQFAIGTVESTMKYAAGTAAPLVKKLDKPIQAVDSFTLNQLVKLEEKVPAIKSQPDEVYTYLCESKDAVTNRITERSDAVRNHLNKSKQAIGDRISSGRDVVYSKIQSGSEVIANSRAGVLIGEGKQAVSTRLSQGKDYIASTLVSGRDAVYTKAQNGAEALANTRAGALVGSGVDSTLTATEGWVDYLLPPEKNELELLDEEETGTELKEKKASSEPEEEKEEASKEEEGEEEEEEEEEEERVKVVAKPGRVQRVKVLSRKVKVRMYYRSLRKLGNIQQQCKSTLEQLRATVDLLKLAQQAREGVDKQYKNLASSIKDLEEHIKQMLSRKEAAGEGDAQASWVQEETGEQEGEIKWLTPKPKTRVQIALDTAKGLSERVYGAFQYVAGAASYLPHQLKGGATSAYEKAHELYTTLKPVKVPTDLPVSALNRISEILDTQLGYVRQLGQFISSTLQRRQSSSVPDEEKLSEEGSESGESTEDEEEGEEDMSADPSTSQPPGAGSGSDGEEN